MSRDRPPALERRAAPRAALVAGIEHSSERPIVSGFEDRERINACVDRAE